MNKIISFTGEWVPSKTDKLYNFSWCQGVCINIWGVSCFCCFMQSGNLWQTRCGYLLMNQTANWMPQLPVADLKGEGLQPLFILYFINFFFYFIKFSFSLKRMGVVLWCHFSGPLYLNLLGTPMTSTYKTWFVQFV